MAATYAKTPSKDCSSDGKDSAKMGGKWTGFWKDIGKPEKHMLTVELCVKKNLILGSTGLDDGRDFDVMIGYTDAKRK